MLVCRLSSPVRLGQATLEVLRGTTDRASSAWLTQVAVEVLRQGPSGVFLGQVAIEILRDDGGGAAAARSFLWIMT